MRYLSGVTTLKLDAEKCVDCGLCLTVCPQEVFSMEEGRVIIKDRDACMECGACAVNCPVEALRVQAGVGCAAALINSALGRQASSCCCSAENRDLSTHGLNIDKTGPAEPKAGCC